MPKKVEIAANEEVKPKDFPKEIRVAFDYDCDCYDDPEVAEPFLMTAGMQPEALVGKGERRHLGVYTLTRVVLVENTTIVVAE